jgi:cell division inhibitor SepF
MSSPFRKALLYLGLGPDEEYDDYGYEESPVVDPRPAPRPQSGTPAPRDPAPAEPPVHVIRPEPEPSPMTPDEPAVSALRPVPTTPAGGGPGEHVELGAVRPIPVSSAKPHVVIPADFNDAQQLGDRFKNSQPVIINLQGADLDLARRVIDFASGLCYGLGGQMERVASQVYLLTPNDVEVSDEDRRRITERGLGRR